MSDASEQYVAEAVEILSQSDPLIKLLQQVQLGRMRATDPGLRAITSAWLNTYQQVLEKGEALDQLGLRRLDPTPRLEQLVAVGIFDPSDAAVVGLCTTYKRSLESRPARP